LGCGHPGGVVPEGAFRSSSREDFQAAAAATVPSVRQVIRLRWHSDDGETQYTGSGAARIAPPDSLRADISATLGLGRATLILTGDSVVARPVNVVDRVLPDRFALWAVLGVLRLPPGELRIEQAGDGERSLWRTTDDLGRATVFELKRGALVSVSRQEAGRITSQLKLARGPDGGVTRASLTDMARNLRLEVSITGRETSQVFPPEVWRLGP
ncbi:MAG: hypothetical protein ACHQU8_08785, partial [Gemmatimonadales bacterium]